MKAILPSTPAEDYPNMEAVEARLRERAKRQGEAFRAAHPARELSKYEAALQAPVEDVQVEGEQL